MRPKEVGTFEGTAGELRAAGHFVQRDVPDWLRVKLRKYLDGETLHQLVEVTVDGQVPYLTVEGLKVTVGPSGQSGTGTPDT